MPDMIFLQPDCCVDWGREGRQWCEHDVWGDDCPNHTPAPMYVLATTAQAQAAAQEQRIAALSEALTPSGDTKAAYMGEFSFNITLHDEDGEEYPHKVYVPWTTIKEIMAAIAARAALGEQQ